MTDWVSRLPELEQISTDVLVLGGGLAGCRAAVAARQRGADVVQAYLARGASPFVIGANVPLAQATPYDSAEQFAADMLEGGYHLNDRRIVEAFAAAAEESFRDLVNLGVPFARDGAAFARRHLSGNTHPRSVFVPEGIGRVVIEHLARCAKDIGVEVVAGWRVAALLQDDGIVFGALLIDRRAQKCLVVQARTVVVAMGGIGRLYSDSTYPVDVAADSYALALEAGATLIDMEFVQFEPLVVVHPEGCAGMEMPTGMLGAGAQLLNGAGERFMFRHNPEHGEQRIEKARLSLCIQQEIDSGRALPDGTVLLDTTKVPRAKLESYISHCKRLRSAGGEPTVEGPHVCPAAHSQMGGVFVDSAGWAGVPGLYVCGEAAGGVHGASRLAGNGGGEAFAMGWLVGRAAAEAAANTPARTGGTDRTRVAHLALRALAGDGRNGGSSREIKSELGKVMRESAGLYRSGPALEIARRSLDRLHAAAREIKAVDLAATLEARSTRNMTLIAGIIARAAFERTESRGAHQRRDFPERDDEHWMKHISFKRRDDGTVAVGTLPIH